MLENLILTVLMTSVPLVYAAIGELIVERSGVLNLGVEGMMLMGAVAAFGVAMVSGSLALGVFAGAIAGMLTASLFGILPLAETELLGDPLELRDEGLAPGGQQVVDVRADDPLPGCRPPRGE